MPTPGGREALTKSGALATRWAMGLTPGPCLEVLQMHPLVAVAGNHDRAALDHRQSADFNSAAAYSAGWTAQQLSEEHRRFLAGLPEVTTVLSFTLVHGSLRAPLREYLLSEEAAAGTFGRLTTDYCLVGHSHIPFICHENREGPGFVQFSEDESFILDDRRWIANPGRCRAAQGLRPPAQLCSVPARRGKRAGHIAAASGGVRPGQDPGQNAGSRPTQEPD